MLEDLLITSISIYTLSDLGDSSNLFGSLSQSMKAKQNRCRGLGVLPIKFRSTNFLKLQEYLSLDDSEGKKRLHGV